MIFDGPIQNMPKGFKAATVIIDGKVTSNLDWSGAESEAQSCIEQSLQILWRLDLGLFHDLFHPLEDESQLKTLMLSIRHFEDKLWGKYAENSLGVVLYRGDLAFSPYGLDDSLHYLILLIRGLSEEIPLYLQLDASTIVDPLECARLLDRKEYDRFQRMVKGSCVPSRDIIWENPNTLWGEYQGWIGKEMGSLPPSIEAKTGILVTKHPKMGKVIQDQLNRGIPVRTFSEEQILAEWDGLDEVVVIEEAMTPSLKRKLLGFSAAGGQIIYQ